MPTWKAQNAIMTLFATIMRPPRPKRGTTDRDTMTVRITLISRNNELSSGTAVLLKFCWFDMSVWIQLMCCVFLGGGGGEGIQWSSTIEVGNSRAVAATQCWSKEGWGMRGRYGKGAVGLPAILAGPDRAQHRTSQRTGGKFTAVQQHDLVQVYLDGEMQVTQRMFGTSIVNL